MKHFFIYIMLIYLAGNSFCYGTDFEVIALNNGLSKLYSALLDQPLINKYTAARPLFVDSGAHSWTKHNINKLGHTALKPPPPVKPHAEFYLKFIEKHKMKHWLFVELDTYHEDDLGQDYIEAMNKEILSIKGNFKFMRVYHPYIDRNNKPLTTFKKWVDEGQDYIGISLDSFDLWGQIFDITKNAIKLHGFACTGPTIIEKYPFYSVDSTTTLVAPGKYGLVPIEYQKFLDRETAVATKDVRYLIDLDMVKRLTHAIEIHAKAQIYYTRLWSERGINWKPGTNH